MSKHLESYRIRWNDLDANRHMANTSYFSLFNDTRMRFLAAHGVTQEVFEQARTGPVIFNESMHYFREVHVGDLVYIDLECSGYSENGTFFEFQQHLYNEKGEICSYLEILAAWFNIDTRKLVSPVEAIQNGIKAIPRSDGFRILKKEDTRRVSPEKMTQKLPIELLR